MPWRLAVIPCNLNHSAGKCRVFTFARCAAEEVVDRLFVSAQGGDVFLCPGDRSYHEIILREGFRDVGAYNPHDRQPASAPHYVAMPAGRVARPVTCVFFWRPSASA